MTGLEHPFITKKGCSIHNLPTSKMSVTNPKIGIFVLSATVKYLQPASEGNGYTVTPSTFVNSRSHTDLDAPESKST